MLHKLNLIHASLVLAVMVVLRNTPPASNDCASVHGKLNQDFSFSDI